MAKILTSCCSSSIVWSFLAQVRCQESFYGFMAWSSAAEFHSYSSPAIIPAGLLWLAAVRHETVSGIERQVLLLRQAKQYLKYIWNTQLRFLAHTSMGLVKGKRQWVTTRSLVESQSKELNSLNVFWKSFWMCFESPSGSIAALRCCCNFFSFFQLLKLAQAR